MARRAKSGSRRRRGSQSGATLAGIALSIGAISIMAIIGWFALRESGRQGLDEDLCPASGPVAHLAILLDMTDPISVTQLQAAEQKIMGRIKISTTGTRISFATISPEMSVRHHSFRTVCKPPSGAEASALTENPKIISETYEQNFLKPISETLNSLMRLPNADASPIMEGLQEFVTTIPGFTTTEIPREIILMSDLMQHSETLSFYRGEDWKSFVGSGGTSRLSRNFGGVSMTVLQFPRVGGRQEALDDFWTRYFDAQGFVSVHVLNLGDL